MNIGILVAVIIQWLISKASRTAGAIVGHLVTTGILIWGLGTYASGGYITFSQIELSQPLFIGLCVVWYVFDTIGLVGALREANAQKVVPEQVQSASASLPPVLTVSQAATYCHMPED